MINKATFQIRSLLNVLHSTYQIYTLFSIKKDLLYYSVSFRLSCDVGLVPLIASCFCSDRGACGLIVYSWIPWASLILTGLDLKNNSPNCSLIVKLYEMRLAHVCTSKQFCGLKRLPSLVHLTSVIALRFVHLAL